MDPDFREIERDRDDRLADEAGEASSTAARDPRSTWRIGLDPGDGFPIRVVRLLAADEAEARHAVRLYRKHHETLAWIEEER